MAQWQYTTLGTELNRNGDLDEDLRKVLKDYGMKGWELVQVLQPRNDAFYHLVFKTERSLYPSLEPTQALSDPNP
jgi:hypothetical protein